MATPLESTSLESTESSSPGTGGLKTETDLEVLNKKLYEAAGEGDINSLQSLLSQGANVNNQDATWDERTPLHTAAFRECNEVVSVLLSNGADPNIKDRWGDTALVYAMRHGYDKIVQFICEQTDPDITIHNNKLYEAAKRGDSTDVQSALSQGANVNYQNPKENGATSLLIATKEGHHDVINDLLSAGADVNLIDIKGDAALIVSARGGHYETVKVLLDNGADPNTHIDPEYDGDTTPLIAAVNNKHHHVVELLLTKGADPNLMDNEGNIALIVSARGGDYETVKVLLNNGADPNTDPEYDYLTLPLIEAAINGHINVVELLLFKGADPNIIDEEGFTALIVSARGGHYETVKVLLDNGADPNPNLSFTPLIEAANKGHVNVVELLLSKGADLNVNSCTTPLIMAAFNGHHQVVKCLLTKGADPNRLDEEGHTALIASAREGHYEIVRNLLGNGADPNTDTGVCGTTPLIVAAKKGHHQVVDLLLAKGANPNTISIDEDTALTAAVKGGHYDTVLLLLTNKADPNTNEPLIMAASEGHHDIVSLLLSKGADPDTVDKSGQTAIGEAVDHGHKNIVELLQNHKNIAYQVLVDSTEEIKECFSDDFFEIANKLLQMNVITEGELSTITAEQNKYQRMEELMERVKVAVKVNKESAFLLFLDIFTEKGTQSATKFAQKLMQRYRDKPSDANLESLSKKAKQYEDDL